MVFLPLAVSAVLASLFVGRAGGAPPTRIILIEIGGVLVILASIVACATVLGSVTGIHLQKNHVSRGNRTNLHSIYTNMY